MGKKQDIYDKVYGMYKHTVGSEQYRKWRDEAKEAWDFYDGLQWTAPELVELQAAGQAPVVANNIAPRVDALVGTEVQSRTRIAYLPRGMSQDDFLMAEGLSNVALQLQDLGNASDAKTEGFKSAVVCGLGAIELVPTETSTVDFRQVDYRQIIYDIDDFSQDGSDSRYRGLTYIDDIDNVKAQFPASAKAIEDMIASKESTDEGEGHKQSSFSLGGEAVHDQPTEFDEPQRNKMLVVMLQYKVPSKVYRYIAEDGREKEIDSKDQAEKLTIDKDSIVELDKDIVHAAYFTKDVLLSNAPLTTQDENFTINLFMYKRRKEDGVPYGVVKPAIDPQKEVNKRRSKALHILNNRQIIADTNAFEDPEYARHEASRPDGIILKRRGTEVQIRDNLGLAESQFRMMEEARNEIQIVTGIHDEFLGLQSNATSGVGISQRVQNTARTQAPAFDRLRSFNKQLGRTLLQIIQTTIPEDYIVNVLDNDNPEMSKAIVLNQVVTDGEGEQHIERDVSAAKFDVTVVEEPDVDVPLQEIQANLVQLLGNGQMQVLAVPELAEILVPRNSGKISAGVSKLLGTSPEQEQPAPQDVPTQGEGGQ